MKLLTALQSKPLLEAQHLYEKYLRLPYAMEPFQHDDWSLIEHHNKTVFVRSRGGSKTKDFTNWIIFHVLRTGEQWCWLACKGGQLQQAMIYVHQNPFVKKVKRDTSAKYDVYLHTGTIIRFGIISTSNLGLRVDGIVYDEFEDLKPMQEAEIYPQMAGMMTHSVTHKTVYLGTLWIKALLNEYVEMYPHVVRPWDSIPWLVKAGMIQEEIDEGKTAEWELDMLYRCIATSPSGLLFNHVEEGEITYSPQEIKYGVDFGSTDTCVGTVERGKLCYVVEEYEVDLEKYPGALDQIKRCQVECEGGGYNDSEKYGEKSKILITRLGAQKRAVTNQWKATRQKHARQFDTIIVNRKMCPHTYSDIKKASFGEDGLYFKHPTKSPCHHLDAFFHSLGKAPMKVQTYKRPVVSIQQNPYQNQNYNNLF